MYYFEYKFTLSLTSSLEGQDEYSQRYDCVCAHFEQICKVYTLDFHHAWGKRYEDKWNQEVSCIAVTLSRHSKQFRSAYNFLKICEASLALYLGIVPYSLLEESYSIDNVS